MLALATSIQPTGVISSWTTNLCLLWIAMLDPTASLHYLSTLHRHLPRIFRTLKEFRTDRASLIRTAQVMLKLARIPRSPLVLLAQRQTSLQQCLSAKALGQYRYKVVHPVCIMRKIRRPLQLATPIPPKMLRIASVQRCRGRQRSAPTHLPQATAGVQQAALRARAQLARCP